MEMQARVLRKELKPLLKEGIESVYIYGSAIREIEAAKQPSSRREKTSDIDVIIIVNDTIPVKESSLQRIDRACQGIKSAWKDKGMDFHFQPPKLLSRWWHSIIDGEPWVISSLKSPIIVYDRKGIVREVCEFIAKETLFNREQKAERLLERSDYAAMSNRQLLLGTINNLANAGTEAAQILLLFDGKFFLNKRAIVEELEKAYVKTLGREVIDTYKEIVDLEEKVNKGTLSEFSAENLDYYLERIREFISKVEDMLGRN